MGGMGGMGGMPGMGGMGDMDFEKVRTSPPLFWNYGVYLNGR